MINKSYFTILNEHSFPCFEHAKHDKNKLSELPLCPGCSVLYPILSETANVILLLTAFRLEPN